MVTQRTFGKPPSLAEMMSRGKMFFDSILDTDPQDVIDRSRHMGKLANSAANLAGERLQLEGDLDAKRLVRAAYLNIGDIALTLIKRHGEDSAESILTSSKSHRSLLLASNTLTSLGMDTVGREFSSRGDHFDVDEDGITFITKGIPRTLNGKGCPYAHGNESKAQYFTNATDHIAKTYIQASRQSLPLNDKTRLHNFFRR